MSGTPKQIEFENEVESSGAMPPSMAFVNHPRIFRKLDQGLLIEQARIWGVRFPLIERIILHRSVCDRRKYIIVIEVPGVDALSKDEKLMAFMNQWQPDSLRSLLENDLQSAFKDPEKWMIELVEPETEIIEVIEASCWLLYEKEKAKEEDTTETAWKEITARALPEVTELYEKATSKNQMPDGITNTMNLQVVLKDKARQRWSEHQWVHIREEDLNINYRLSSGKERRDFVTRILKRILDRCGFDITLTTIRGIL